MKNYDNQRSLSDGFHLRSDLHLLRKIWHIGTGLTGLFLHFKLGATTKETGVVLLSVAIAGFSIDLLRSRIPALNNVVLKLMKPFMRDSEKDGMSGFPFYALGTAASLLLFSPEIAILSCLFLIFADPIASLFGIQYGSKKIYKNKSLEGAVAGFVTCFIISFLYMIRFSDTNINLLLFSMLSGVIGAASEVLSVKIDDNLMIPILSGAGMTMINLFIPIV
jgi:dolichol kinase